MPEGFVTTTAGGSVERDGRDDEIEKLKEEERRSSEREVVEAGEEKETRYQKISNREDEAKMEFLPTATSQAVALSVLETFDGLHAKFKPQKNQWTVLAGIVIEHPDGHCECISLG